MNFVTRVLKISWKGPCQGNIFAVVITFKGCVYYFFASLFCKPKGKHLWNKEKCFLFHIKSAFCSCNNKFHFFQIFMKYSWDIHEMSWMMSSNVQAWITKHILFNNLGSKHSDNDIWLFYVILKKKKFYWKILWKMWPGKTSSRLFFIFKEPSVKRNLSRSTCWFWQISIVLLLHIYGVMA